MLLSSLLSKYGIGIPDALSSLPEPILSVVLASIILGFLLVFVKIVSASLGGLNASKGTSIILTGPMNSGKTLLYYRLKLGVERETLPSMKENVETFEAVGLKLDRPMKYVDFPGHGSKRHGLSKYLEDARHVVFCIDVSDQSSIKVAAQSLFDVLSNDSVFRRRVPVFIALCKSDLQSANNTIATLEKEVGAIRDSRSEMIEDLASSDCQRTLGVPGQAFKFQQCPSAITVGSISAKTGDIGSLSAALE